MNPYQILDVPTDATDEEIKKQYHKLAKENHPDHGGDPETMTKINKAYNLISTPEKRRRFQEEGDEPIEKIEEWERMLIALVQQAFIESETPIKYINLQIKKKKTEWTKVRNEHQSIFNTTKRKLERYEKRNPEPNLIKDAVIAALTKIERALKEVEFKLECIKTCESFMKGITTENLEDEMRLVAVSTMSDSSFFFGPG